MSVSQVYPLKTDDDQKFEQSLNLTKNRFKAIVDNSGVTRYAIAKETGLSSTTVSELYYDPWKCPTQRSLTLICLYFNIQPSELLYVPDVITETFHNEGIEAAIKLAKQLRVDEVAELDRTKTLSRTKALNTP